MIRLPVELAADPDDDRFVSCLVPVTVNGRPESALLDSGAARSAVVDRDGLDPVEVTSTGGGVFGQHRRTDRRAVVDLAVGDVPIGPCEVTVVAPDHPGHGTLIGQDVLSRWCCRYDLGAAQVTLGVAPLREGTAVDVGVRGRHVVMEISWSGGLSARGLFDTGAQTTVVHSEFVRRHPHLFIPDGTSPGTDSDGHTVDTPMVQMAPMTLLRSNFPATAAAVVDLSGALATAETPFDLILGWPVLQHGCFVVDHDARLAVHLGVLTVRESLG